MALSVHSFQADYAEFLVHAISQTVPHTIDAMRQALAEQIAESRQHAEELNQETRVLLEDMRHDLQGVAEGVFGTPASWCQIAAFGTIRHQRKAKSVLHLRIVLPNRGVWHD